MSTALDRIGRIARSVAAGLAACIGSFGPAQAQAPRVDVLVIDGMINPANADLFSRGLAQNQASNSSLVSQELDTPGGRDTGMRALINAVLHSTNPAPTWV